MNIFENINNSYLSHRIKRFSGERFNNNWFFQILKPFKSSNTGVRTETVLPAIQQLPIITIILLEQKPCQLAVLFCYVSTNNNIL